MPIINVIVRLVIPVKWDRRKFWSPNRVSDGFEKFKTYSSIKYLGEIFFSPGRLISRSCVFIKVIFLKCLKFIFIEKPYFSIFRNYYIDCNAFGTQRFSCGGGGGGGAGEMANAFRVIKGQGHVFAIKVSALKFPQILRKILIFPYLIDYTAHPRHCSFAC